MNLEARPLNHCHTELNSFFKHLNVLHHKELKNIIKQNFNKSQNNFLSMGYVIPKSVDHLTDPGHSLSHSKIWCAARREEVRTATCRVGSVQQEALEIYAESEPSETSGTLLKASLGISTPHCFSRQVYISLDQAEPVEGLCPYFHCLSISYDDFAAMSAQEMWLTKTMTFGGKKLYIFSILVGVHFY